MLFNSKGELLEYAGKERSRQMAEPVLRSLFFELTDGCNLHCLHCGSNCGPDKARYLSIESIRKTLESVKANIGTDKTFIVLSGGEPLLHPDFLSIISLIDGMGFRFGMTTNATLIDEKMAYKLKEAHIMSIGFSLDGDKDSHNRFRGSAKAYDACIEGIKNFVGIAGDECTTMITSVLHSGNFDQLEDLYKLAKELKVDYFRPINVEPIGRANEHPELFLSKEQFKGLLDFIKEHRKKNSVPEVTYGCSHALPEEYELEVRRHPFFCMAGIQIASVLVSGDIYACLDIERRKELVQGNVDRDDFHDVWKNRFAFYRKDRSDVSFCKGCPHRDFCKGDSAHTWNYGEGKPNLCLIKWFAE